jgi:radical SAM-linked protein
VQRLRVRYAKTGRLRFTSHRDFARAFERALRRAAAPMAYSAGFSPHPKISYAGAAPTGVASCAEYLEISLMRAVDPDALRVSLDAALPPGLDIITVAEVPIGRGGALAELLEASRWQIGLPGAAQGAVETAIDRLLDLPEAPVRRATKDGHRILDARAAIVALTCQNSAAQPDEGAPYVTMQVVVRHTTPAVRPDDVVTALREHAGLSTPEPSMVTRLAQGRLPEQGVGGRAAQDIELLDPFTDEVAAARS